MKLFKLIDQIHKYSDLSELEQYFDKGDLSKLESPDWSSNNYDEIVKLKDKYDQLKKPNYSENTLKNDNQDLILWDKPEGLSKAKARKRHILVFNSSNATNVTINFKFDAKIQSENLKTVYKSKATSNNRTITLEMCCDKIDPAYEKLEYFNYTFYIMVVNCEPKLLSEIEDKFYIDLNQKSELEESLLLTMPMNCPLIQEQRLSKST